MSGGLLSTSAGSGTGSLIAGLFDDDSDDDSVKSVAKPLIKSVIDGLLDNSFSDDDELMLMVEAVEAGQSTPVLGTSPVQQRPCNQVANTMQRNKYARFTAVGKKQDLHDSAVRQGISVSSISHGGKPAAVPSTLAAASKPPAAGVSTAKTTLAVVSKPQARSISTFFQAKISNKPVYLSRSVEEDQLTTFSSPPSPIRESRTPINHHENNTTKSSCARLNSVEIADPCVPKIDISLAVDYLYPNNFPKRDYQLNISHHALFKNTLVCLPTGTLSHSAFRTIFHYLPPIRHHFAFFFFKSSIFVSIYSFIL